MHNHLFFSFKHACRRLRKIPAFCAGVILLLGVALGGTVAVSTAAYQLFFKALPYAQPDELVEWGSVAHAMNGFRLGISPAMLRELQQDGSLGQLAAFEEVEARQDGDGESWRHAALDEHVLSVLRINPVIGRGFTAQDILADAPVALLSERAWRSRFNGSDDALGQTLELEDRTLSIIGVLPDAFAVPAPDAEIWTPLVFEPQLLAPASISSFTGLDVIGRLPPGMNAAVATQQLQARYADDPRLAPMIEITGLELAVNPLQQAWTSQYRPMLSILTTAILLVLLAAALNLAGLWMSRTLGRSHELAIQAALGGSRWVAVQAFVIEYLLLGIAGVVLALLLAPLALNWLSALNVIDSELPIRVGIGPVAVMLAGCFLLLSAVPVLLAVWWQSHRVQQHAASELVSGGTSARSAGARGRNMLIVAQLAMAMSLLVTVALLLQSWRALLSEDLGFDSRRLVMAYIGIDVEDDAGPEVVEQIGLNLSAAIEQMHGIAGVESVSFASVAPFSASETISSYTMPDNPEIEHAGRTRQVGLDYFRTLGIAFQQGRTFGTEHLSEDHRWVVVDQGFAKQHFASAADAIGQRIQYDTPGQSHRPEIIGVVQTIKHSAPDEQTGYPTIYFPARTPYRSAHVLINTSLPPETLVQPVRDRLQQQLGVDNVSRVSSMQSMVRRTLREREPQLILLTVFAGITVLLAAVGIYALLSYAVRQRTAEFGVRLAVGANAWRIRGLVLNSGLRLLIPGVLLGIAGAVLGGHLIADQLYDVEVLSPASWAAVAGVLLAIVLLAGLWPSEQAARTAPTEALRYE